MRYVIQLHFAASNNVAEYEALIAGLRIAVELGVRHLDVRGDSQLIIDQVIKSSSCRAAAIPRWKPTARRYGALRTNSTASSSNTLHADIMKPPMNSRKYILVEP
jgi:ribonuclease HI